MKRCGHCKQTLPADQFHRSKRSRDGLQNLCRDCHNLRRRERRDVEVKRIAESVATSDGKKCPRCETFKPWSEFHANRRQKDGKQAYCKPCGNDVRREYEQRNAEAIALRRAERLARSATEGTKQCTKCGETKPLLSFYAHRGTKDGRSTYCAECQKAASRQWTRNNAERVRERNAQRSREQKQRDHRQWWLKLYNLTPDQYAELLVGQDGVCAICLQSETYIDARTGEPRRLAVDHDHASGAVRGLLCGRCNRALGQFNDSIDVVQRAADYLRAARADVPT